MDKSENNIKTAGKVIKQIYSYMPSHPHFCTFSRIENVHPLSPAFCLKHPQSPAFCLMQTNYPDRSFRMKKREKLAIDLFKCDQSN